MAAGTGKSSTHPIQRDRTGFGHRYDDRIIQINDLRSTGLDGMALSGRHKVIIVDIRVIHIGRIG